MNTNKIAKITFLPFKEIIVVLLVFFSPKLPICPGCMKLISRLTRSMSDVKMEEQKWQSQDYRFFKYGSKWHELKKLCFGCPVNSAQVGWVCMARLWVRAHASGFCNELLEASPMSSRAAGQGQ